MNQKEEDMNYTNLLKSVAKTLSSVDVGGTKKDAGLAELDRGILQVALMVSGLDGTILLDEYEAFGEMAKKCRGATAKGISELFDAAIGKASTLAEMARSGVYSEAKRLAAFVRMSEEALPKGFACGSMADLRRAFALWVAMGVSDGAFTGFERKAVHSLMRRFALMRTAKSKRFTALLEPDFFAKVEKLMGDMSVASKRAKAEEALNELISMVGMKEKGGKKAFHAAGKISLSMPLPGPTITGWK